MPNFGVTVCPRCVSQVRFSCGAPRQKWQTIADRELQQKRLAAHTLPNMSNPNTIPVRGFTQRNHFRPRIRADRRSRIDLAAFLYKLTKVHPGVPNRMSRRFLAQFICSWTAALWCLILWPAIVSGQTLSERLVQEDAAKLAEQARKQGNIVRGAILFHQGNINCIKCHRSNQGDQPIAPDLSRSDPKATDSATTDAAIVESILLPSKVIRKGYESIQVLTTGGLVIVGTPLEQNDQAIVLRSAQNPDERITIPKSEIEEQKPSNVSTMPNALADQLQDRQQFLDLVRYVIDMRERGANQPTPAGEAIAHRELSPELKGLTLIRNKNCIACHKAQPDQLPFAETNAPNLFWSARRLNPRYLQQYILSPHQTKLGSHMPTMLHTLKPEERLDAAAQIAIFLLTLNGTDFRSDNAAKEPEAIKRGQEIFHTIGCVACHATRDPQAVEQTLAGSVPLGDLSPKYSVEALVEFLENPHASRPLGRMPNLQLSHREALDLAAYLLQTPNRNGFSIIGDGVSDSSAYAKKGERLFLDSGCITCHSNLLPPDIPAYYFKNIPDWSSITKSPLDRGCLSVESGAWPNFQLTTEERSLIQAACRANSQPLDAQQKIDWTLATFQCTSCHSRAGLGGVSIDRNHFFQTTNLNLGDQGRIPPTLTGVGAKLQEKWMREVLISGRVIRPYMKTRMPQFGEKNVGHLIELFQRNDTLEPVGLSPVENREAARKLGLEIAGNQGLNCVACHTYQYKLSDTMPAVDLTEMAERLKKDWFHQYMLAPQKFSPNTVMPSFWPGGKAIRPDIQGNAASQIEALWQYLLDGRQANAPRGVIREPLEIVVRDQARLLRRSYEGIGKRGIGVGYPGDVNIAFDAEQLRLAMLWKGKFVDPAGVWYGQGHGNVRTLGRPFQMPRGPELDDATSPWAVDESRPPKHRFLGYELDVKRRPTFAYEFDGVRVSDFFAESPAIENRPFQLRRTVKLNSDKGRANLRFRIASGNMTVVDQQTYRLENGLQIKVSSPLEPVIIGEGNERILQIPLDLTAGRTIEFSIEYLWE
jgi:putative heme-binding domain-containing protein